MKKFFLPLLAVLGLVGCSQSDEPENNGGSTSDELGYVAVNIVQSSNGSKAASLGFEYGSDDENYAQQGLFFVFNNGGTALVGTPQRLALTPTGDQGNTPEVEKIYKAVLVIDGVTEEPVDAYQIVCVLNAPAGLEHITTLEGLTQEVGNYGGHTKGAFIMSNSVYKENGEKVLGAVITANNIKKSSSEALNNPVEIYVERVVARIDVSTKGDFQNAGHTATIDGVDTKLNINIKGLEIANIADKSFLFKDITGVTYNWAWDAKNKRSYWETCPNTLGYLNQSYTQISPAGFNIATATLKQYIQPNTTDQKTSVLVTAQLTEEATGNPLSFIYVKGGYFSVEKAGDLLASYLANKSSFWIKKDLEGGKTEYSQLPGTAFEWKNKNDFAGETLSADEQAAINALEDYEVIGRLKTTGEGAVDSADIFVKNGENYEPATVADVNKALLDYVAEYWNDGMCYYFVEIDQTPVANDNRGEDPEFAKNTFLGVVRNHIYKLSLSSIKGLGTPVFDPEDVIIPTRRQDDDLWFLAAEVQVLAWKVAEQDIDFDM